MENISRDHVKPHARSHEPAPKDHDRPVFSCIVDFRVRPEVLRCAGRSRYKYPISGIP